MGSWTNEFCLLALAVTCIFALIWSVYFVNLSRPQSKHFIQLWLRLTDTSWDGSYQFWSRSLSIWFDRIFERRQKFYSHWSATAFDRSILLSVCYPVSALTIGWFVFGDVGILGEALGLLPHDSTIERAIIVLWLGITFGAYLYLASRDRDWLGFFVLVILLAGGATLLAGILAFNIPIFVVVFGLFIALLKNVGLLNGAGVVVLTVSVAFISLLGAAETLTEVIIGLTAASVATTLVSAADQTVNNRAKYFWTHWVPRIQWSVNLSVFALAALSCFLVPRFINPDELNSGFYIPLLVLLCLIPSVKIPFDFVSHGMTRKLVRASYQERSLFVRILICGLEIVVAIVSVVLFCLVMVFALEAFNAVVRKAGGEFAIPVASQIAEIGQTGGFVEQHFWLYLAIFVYLVPMLWHFLIIAASSFVFVTRHNLWVADSVQRLSTSRASNVPQRALVAAVLSLPWLFAVALLVSFLLGLWSTFLNVPYLGSAFLSLMETTQSFTEDLFA